MLVIPSASPVLLTHFLFTDASFPYIPISLSLPTRWALTNFMTSTDIPNEHTYLKIQS